MLRAEVGDQLVGLGVAGGRGEILGMVIQVHGEDRGPPFTVRWYDDGHASKIDPDPEQFWIRPQVDDYEVGMAALRDRRVA
jgi:hypothetical protein